MNATHRPHVGTVTVQANRLLTGGVAVTLFNDSDDSRTTLHAETKHAAVLCAATGRIVALTGPAGDRESVDDTPAAELQEPPSAAAMAAAQDAIELATGAHNPANYPLAARV